MSNSTLALCQLAHNVVYSVPYHVCQWITFGLSFFSILPLLNMIFRRLNKCTFNMNTRCVLQFHFSMGLLLVGNCFVSFGLHVYTAWIADSACDLLVDPQLYRILQYVGLAGVVGPMLTTHAIFVERLIALFFAGYYEEAQVWIGIVLTCLVIIGDAVTVMVVFSGETFLQPTYSYFMIPDSSGATMNRLCWILLLSNTINLVFNGFLIKINQYLKNKWRHHPLSTRFQLEENILTTKFSTFISLCQVATFFFYLIVTLANRMLGTNVFSYLYVQIFRGIYLSMPIHNFAIPFLASWYLDHLYGKKKQRTAAEVALDYSGEQGTRNHEMITMRIWSTTSTKIQPL